MQAVQRVRRARSPCRRADVRYDLTIMEVWVRKIFELNVKTCKFWQSVPVVFRSMYSESAVILQAIIHSGSDQILLSVMREFHD